MKQPLISVIIPAYNEERNITKVIKNVAKLKKEYAIEIIVVDDGSKDKTAQVAKKAGADRVITYEKNKGKGGAFRVGIDAAKGDYIVQIDADHQFQPDEIPLFVKALQEGYDVVCGTRFDNGTVEQGSVSKVNLFGNWLMSTVTTFFSGMRSTDIMAGFKGFTKDAARKLDLVTPHFGYEAEIVVKAGKLGLQVKEVPITYTKRTSGSSSVHAVKDGIRVSYTIAKMYLTFPGPPPGHGVVGKKMLSVIIPLWLILVLPVVSYLTGNFNGTLHLFETQYIIAFLLFFTAMQFTNSRLAALVTSAFFAAIPLSFPKAMFGNFSLIYSMAVLIGMMCFTIFFLKEKKGLFFKQILLSGIFLNLSLFFLQDQILLTTQWLSLNFSLIGIFLGLYFWNEEKKFARSIIISSGIMIISIVIRASLLRAIGQSLFFGTFISALFLETVSFKITKSPLFSFSRVIRALLLGLLLCVVFILKIMHII